MSQNEGFIAHARNGGEVEVKVNNGKKKLNWMDIVTLRILLMSFTGVITTGVSIVTKVKVRHTGSENLSMPKVKK